MSREVVMFNNGRVKPHMKCGICNKVYREATTITLCLHTFCKTCILEKISEQDNPCCPVCKIDLGCKPEEKLRPDNSLQNLVASFFPPKGSKVNNVPEVTPSDAPLDTRKEGSLSSLVESKPRVSVQDGKTGRKKKSGARKGSATSSAISATEETPKRVDDSIGERIDGPSSPKTLNKIMQNKNQNSSGKSSNDQIPGELMVNNSEGLEGKVNLAEAANGSNFSKANMQGPSHDNTGASGSGDIDMSEMRIKVNEKKAKVQGGKGSMPSVPGTGKYKRGHPKKNRSSAPSETSSSKVVVTETRQNGEDSPHWFYFVASEDQVGCEPLPQLSTPYVKLKDLSMTISTVQKYLAQKLGLANDTEVQIMFHGELLVPDMKLSSIVEAWIKAFSSRKKIKVYAGDSAKDFMIVLSYARRVAASTI